MEKEFIIADPADHSGHRKRVKKRIEEYGLIGMAPHEVLEVLLFFCIARGDVNNLSHNLIDRFGSLRGVLNASEEEMKKVKGVGTQTAGLLHAFGSAVLDYDRAMEKKAETGEGVSEILEKLEKTPGKEEDIWMILMGPGENAAYYGLLPEPFRVGKELNRKNESFAVHRAIEYEAIKILLVCSEKYSADIREQARDFNKKISALELCVENVLIIRRNI